MIELDDDWDESMEQQYPGSIAKFIGPIPCRQVYVPCNRDSEPQLLNGDYVCHTCKRYLERNAMPPMSNQNSLQFVNIDNHPELKLSELEQQLIALNILFQKIVLLPKSRMSAMKDKTVSVPINPSDVMETLTKLPRTPADARLAVVQLKRRLNFPGVHNQQLIDLRKVFQALHTFIAMKNPHYQNILEDDDFKQRCFRTDPEGYKILFPEEEIDLKNLGIYSQTKEEEIDISGLEINSQKTQADDESVKNSDGKMEEDEEEEYIKHDAIGKNQFNYNRSTCFGENHPEIHVDENTTDPVQVAPGQGKIPRSLLQEKDFDVKSFPSLFPDGKNGKDQERKITLNEQDYWCQRILNVDERCANSPAFTFMAAAHTELKQMNRNINLSFQRGLEKVRPDGSCVYSLEDPYMVLDNIKNTPRYWKKARQELFAKLENLGPFTFFFTLSCADIRWPENFTSLLEGHKITFESIDGKEEFYIDDQPLDEFLTSYPSKHEFIRNNLLNATLNFQHRLRMFLKHIILSKGSSLTLSHYNYRIEFQLRGAPHAHGTLWMDWKRFTALPRHTVNKIERALNLIKAGEELSVDQKQALTEFADLFISVSLKNPTTAEIVKEVNVHHHTTKACRKYGTACRFNFPRFPIHKTIISAPSNITYPEEKERNIKMKQHKDFLDGVKEVLEDETIYQAICVHKKTQIQAIINERQLKWRLKEFIDEAQFNKQSVVSIPEDLLIVLKDIVDSHGKVSVKDLAIKEAQLMSHEESLDGFMKERVEKLLSHVNPECIDKDSSLLQQYEQALSVNKKGYSIHYKRDIDEIMVNTYNPEWICAWNGNMDFQLCLDYFAVITYISDYYCKDDSGTMQILQEALRESMNDDLRTRLKKMVSVFLTHRQMGESEAYYRIIPSMHMKDSDVKTVFAQTGFNPSRYLEQVDDKDVDKCDKVVEVEGRKGKYQEKPSLYEKYFRRDCKTQPHLRRLCYAQFVKRYQSVGKIDDDFNFSPVKVKKMYDENGSPIFENHIIAGDYDELDYAIELPKFITITDLKPGELPFMRLRSPQVLRYHKFNREKNPHEYFFSELQLYLPHANGSKCNLMKEREDYDVCQKTFLNSDICNVKGKIMEFLESVEEGMEKAQEMKNTIGDELDPQNEQDRAECEAEGTENHPDFILTDPSNLEREVESSSTALFKTVKLCSDQELECLTEKLDSDQKIALSLVLNYSRQLIISRTSPMKVDPPMLIIQGGAGAGKSLLIKAIVQWFEKDLRQSGDDPDKPYVLTTAFTGTAAANVDGMTLHSAFNFNFGNEFLSLGDKTRDEKREQLKNLKMVIIDEFSMLKADLLYQFDLRLRELKQNTEEAFGGCAILLLGDILQLRPVMGRYIFEQPLCADYHLPHMIDPLWNKFQVLLLTHNHRQGEDFLYAEILNRVRSGQQTDEDCRVLEKRVRPMGSKDIPDNALYIICTNAGVNIINENKLEDMEGQCYSFHADVSRSGKPLKNPKRSRDGSVFNTPLQLDLHLKIGAQVMLTYNVDVLDSLTNGTIGKVMGFETSSENAVKTVLVHFKDEKSGKERRKKNSRNLTQKFLNTPVTPISRIEFQFNMSKNPSSQNDFMKATQFPLKLSFACTAHKMQGSTVVKPDSLAIDLQSVKEAAQGYVMMSRVQSLDQLYILNEFPSNKLYPSLAAMEELQRLKNIALNEQEKAISENTLIISLNIRSLPRHHSNLKGDPRMVSKVIALQETWCDTTHDNQHLELPGYKLHLVSQGRGKGVATYFKSEFQVSGSINTDFYQMLRVSSTNLDVINIYRSQNANKANFLKDLGSLARGAKPCFIVGDFNIDYLQNPDEEIIKKISSCSFKQIVESPTHIAGAVLDHVYVKKATQAYHVIIHFPYYSDHAAIFVCGLNS